MQKKRFLRCQVASKPTKSRAVFPLRFALNKTAVFQINNLNVQFQHPSGLLPSVSLFICPSHRTVFPFFVRETLFPSVHGVHVSLADRWLYGYNPPATAPTRGISIKLCLPIVQHFYVQVFTSLCSVDAEGFINILHCTWIRASVMHFWLLLIFVI